MTLMNSTVLRGYKGKYKVIKTSEDGQMVTITFNGQCSRDCEILHDKKVDYIIYNKEKVVLEQ